MPSSWPNGQVPASWPRAAVAVPAAGSSAALSREGVGAAASRSRGAARRLHKNVGYLQQRENWEQQQERALDAEGVRRNLSALGEALTNSTLVRKLGSLMALVYDTATAVSL
jgi:hypothetical protein